MRNGQVFAYAYMLYAERDFSMSVFVLGRRKEREIELRRCRII